MENKKSIQTHRLDTLFITCLNCVIICVPSVCRSSQIHSIRLRVFSDHNVRQGNCIPLTLQVPIHRIRKRKLHLFSYHYKQPYYFSLNCISLTGMSTYYTPYGILSIVFYSFFYFFILSVQSYLTLPTGLPLRQCRANNSRLYDKSHTVIDNGMAFISLY